MGKNFTNLKAFVCLLFRNHRTYWQNHKNLVLQQIILSVIKNMSYMPSKSLIKLFSSVSYVTLHYKCLKLTKIRKVDIRKKLDIRNFSLLTKMFLISRVDCIWGRLVFEEIRYFVELETLVSNQSLLDYCILTHFGDHWKVHSY